MRRRDAVGCGCTHGMIYQGRVISNRSRARASAQQQPRTVFSSAVHTAVAPERLRAHASRCAVALPCLDRCWHRGRDGKICHRHDDSLSRPLMVCALEGGAVQTLGANAEGGSGEGESGRRPGTAFLVDAAHCGCCMWCMPHATCIISSILNSVVASGGVVGAGLSDDSKHHASLTMLSSVSMSSPLRSLCCASVGDRMSRRATRPQSR